MKRKDLIKAISSNTGFSIKKSTKILDTILKEIGKSLQCGKDISLRNFGTLKLDKKNKRRFYNISTQSVEELPERSKVKFVSSKQINKSICKTDNLRDNRNNLDYSPCQNNIDETIKSRDNHIPKGKNIGKRRIGDFSEYHDNCFDFVGVVNYEHYLGENEHLQFPSVKTPQKGTKILKWYKSHKDAITGVSEPLLLAKILNLCKKYKGLILLEKIAIPILNREYSYRPDIALYWEKYNLCIDIEIDEPYDICSHKPLHYIGCSDNLRDTYFIRNGWCVIRYSENQVLNHLNDTINHLEYVINWLTNSTRDSHCLIHESRWTYDEAIKIASSFQRENNIGIGENEKADLNNSETTVNTQVFSIKPDDDILPKYVEQPHELIIGTQLDYALASNAQYVRLTRNDGYQFILDKNTIQKGVEDELPCIKATNICIPLLKSFTFKIKTISQITPISTLFTDIWKFGDTNSAKEILIKAASVGSPIWIKYKNSQGEISERFISNMGLFISEINANAPFTALGAIANPEKNWRTYIFGYCSFRNEFRQFACDHRLLEVKILNCKNNFIYTGVYENSLADLVMHPNGKLCYFERVDYILNIMPEKEKNSLFSKGNIANYEVFKGNLDTAFKIYTSVDSNEYVGDFEREENKWYNVCIDDIEHFIKTNEKEPDTTYDYDITPSKIVENFNKVKSMLIQAGWTWKNDD